MAEKKQKKNQSNLLNPPFFFTVFFLLLLDVAARFFCKGKKTSPRLPREVVNSSTWPFAPSQSPEHPIPDQRPRLVIFFQVVEEIPREREKLVT